LAELAEDDRNAVVAHVMDETNWERFQSKRHKTKDESTACCAPAFFCTSPALAPASAANAEKQPELASAMEDNSPAPASSAAGADAVQNKNNNNNNAPLAGPSVGPSSMFDAMPDAMFEDAWNDMARFYDSPADASEQVMAQGQMIMSTSPGESNGEDKAFVMPVPGRDGPAGSLAGKNFVITGEPSLRSDPIVYFIK
jgi:hypothetical protein